MTARCRRTGIDDRWRGADGGKGSRYGVGKRWRARFVDDAGVEHSRSFDRKSDAQAYLDQITSDMVTGTYVDPAAGRITVGVVYGPWAASQAHISAKTAATRLSTWRTHVEPRWADVAVVDVNTSAVRAWVSELAGAGFGVATIENAFGLLRLVLGAAVEDRRIPRNPCYGVKLPKRPHPDRGYLDDAQVAALAGAVERDSEVVRFLAYTGLRFGEMAALRVQDFDMLRRRVNVSRSVTEVSGRLVWSTPKTWERRSVPFPAELADELAARMVGKGRDDLVFTDTRGGPLRNNNWRERIFEPAVAKCQAAATAQRARELAATGETVTPDFPTITPHDLRHTAASLAIRGADANVKAVQRMLGHAKASMTLDVYADLFEDDLDAVAERMNALIVPPTVPAAVPLRSQRVRALLT